jgi:cytochrome c
MRRFTGAVVALAAGLALASSVAAQTPADIGLGKRLYQEKATCGFCHGWSGNGAGDPQSPGKARICVRPSLTTISWRSRSVRSASGTIRDNSPDQG